MSVVMYGCAKQQTNSNNNIIAKNSMNMQFWLEFFKSASIATCMIPHFEAISNCYSKHKDYMEETNVNGTTDKMIKDYCCSVHGFKSCVVKIISQHCGTKDHVKQVTDSFADELNRALQVNCDGYTSFFSCLDNWMKAGMIILILLLIGALVSIIVYCYQKNS